MSAQEDFTHPAMSVQEDGTHSTLFAGMISLIPPYSLYISFSDHHLFKPLQNSTDTKNNSLENCKMVPEAVLCWKVKMFCEDRIMRDSRK